MTPHRLIREAVRFRATYQGDQDVLERVVFRVTESEWDELVRYFQTTGLRFGDRGQLLICGMRIVNIDRIDDRI